MTCVSWRGTLASSASRRARRPEHDLIHPDKEAVAADDADGHDGPNSKGKDEECQQFSPPGLRPRRFGSGKGGLAVLGHDFLMCLGLVGRCGVVPLERLAT